MTHNCSEVIKTPPQSANHKPVEAICKELESGIQKQKISPEQQLKFVVQNGWSKISPEVIKERKTSTMQA